MMFFKWRRWINAGLVSSRASILVNGSPTSEFSLKRGLRQGDPLSPFLFIMVMEEWNQCDMDNIIRIPDVFYLAFGLKININKSNLYGVGVSSEEVTQMPEGTGCSSSSIPFTYLGLPIGSNMGRISNWSILIDQFKARLSGWKANMLSARGSLGVGSYKTFNMSLLLKWRWRLLNHPYALWVKVMKAIHGGEVGFELLGSQSNGV
nr:hypothetical protein [Tanacetum cinerariifolium]